MATAVLDLDFDNLPPEITGLERYQRALILVRFRGNPIAQANLNLVGDRISRQELREAMAQAAADNIAESWTQELLEWQKIQTKNFAMPSATVAICTRDRPDDAARCLAALTRLEPGPQELLVIDNCPSTEATREIVERYSSVRYVREPRPGLNVARNRALREAQTDIVVFTDDDAVPDPHWLRPLLQNFADPLVLCVTGLTMPLEMETDAQEWHERYSTFARGFKRRVFDSTYWNPMAVGQVGSGVNMALRRSVLKLVGQFDEALDSGTRTKSGGDAEMFSRILSSGYRIVYEPRALNWHRHRRTWRELRRMVYGYGVGVCAFLTRSLLIEREFGAPWICWTWFCHKQLPTLIRSLLRRRDRIPLDLIVAELCGCIAGPWAYITSRKEQLKRSDQV